MAHSFSSTKIEKIWYKKTLCMYIIVKKRFCFGPLFFFRNAIDYSYFFLLLSFGFAVFLFLKGTNFVFFWVFFFFICWWYDEKMYRNIWFFFVSSLRGIFFFVKLNFTSFFSILQNPKTVKASNKIITALVKFSILIKILKLSGHSSWRNILVRHFQWRRCWFTIGEKQNIFNMQCD